MFFLKQISLILCAALLWLALGSGAWPEPEPEPDWLSQLLDAVVDDDREAGLAAAAGWNADESRQSLDYDELRLLSKLITWEAGSRWLSDELRLGVGEVALNRVASPEFPDTLEEVIYQDGQYAGTDTYDFRVALLPSRPCAEAALRLLLGERFLAPQAVFAGHAVQGKVHSVFRDLHYGSIYFCESRYPELYKTGEDSLVVPPAPSPAADGIAARLRECLSRA